MEFEINGNTYRSGKLDAFVQFHVARRLAPVQAALFKAGAAAQGQPEQVAGGTAMAGLAEAIAGMPDADCDFVLMKCLGAVQRKQDSGWSNITAAGGKSLTFSDIDMLTMLQITQRVIEENLGGFFGESADPSPSPPSPTA